MRSVVLTAALILMPPLGAEALGLGPAAHPLGNATPLVTLPAWDGAAKSVPDPFATGSVAAVPDARAPMPLKVVQKCRRAIVAAAIPYGVAQVDAAGAGPLMAVRTGYVAPIEFTIVYAKGSARETREATVACLLDEAGRVTGVR
jgi:hypothetical protein